MNNKPIKIGAENQYILYYSNYCINCKEFLNILVKNQPLYQKFNKLNISDSNSPKPPFLKAVPTILVPNVNIPLTGSDVFKWLEQQSTQRRKQEQKDIEPYHPSEMSGNLGNNYSYFGLDDRNQPMKHNFTFIDNKFQKIETPAEESFANTKPKKLKDISMNNRQMFPQIHQAQQMRAPTNSLPPPISSSEDGNVEDAYNNLLSRRDKDVPLIKKNG